MQAARPGIVIHEYMSYKYEYRQLPSIYLYADVMLEMIVMRWNQSEVMGEDMLITVCCRFLPSLEMRKMSDRQLSVGN